MNLRTGLPIAAAVGSAGLIVLAALQIYLGAVQGWLRFIDWSTYDAAVDRVLAGGPLYSAVQLSGPYYLGSVVGTGYVYPPTSILLFVPFGVVPGGEYLWIVGCALLLGSGIVAICARAVTGPMQVVLTFGTLVAVGTSLPFLQGITVGTVDVALAGLFAWMLALGRGNRFVPAAAAVGGVVKMVAGSLLFWTERPSLRRTVALSAAIGVLLTAAAVPLVGVRVWPDYASVLANSVPDCAPPATPSVACLLAPSLGVALAKAVTIPAAVGLGVAALFVRSNLAAAWLVALAWAVPIADFHAHTWLVLEVPAVATAASVADRVAGRRSAELPA